MQHYHMPHPTTETLPVKRLLFRSPLFLKTIRATVGRRATKIELLIAILTAPANHFPIEQIIRAQREIFPQRGSPRDNQISSKEKTYSATNDTVILMDQHKFGAVGKLIEDRGKEFP